MPCIVQLIHRCGGKKEHSVWSFFSSFFRLFFESKCEVFVIVVLV